MGNTNHSNSGNPNYRRIIYFLLELLLNETSQFQNGFILLEHGGSKDFVLQSMSRLFFIAQ